MKSKKLLRELVFIFIYIISRIILSDVSNEEIFKA